MRLTEQQLAYMETFGFLHFPGLVADRIDRITEEFENVWAGRGGGHDGMVHDGKARSCIVPFADQTEYLSSLLDDERLDGILTSLLGEDYVYLGSDGNYYVGDTNWHSDRWWEHDILYYKIAFYLDELTRDTGALRVIPGSHRRGDRFADEVETGRRTPEETWGVSGDQVPALVVETVPGDVVVFNQATKHSAWGGGTRRRMFTLNCTRRHEESEIPILRQEVGNFARFWTESVYGEAMVNTASPARMRHLEQPLANQDHLQGLVTKAKQEKAEPSRG